ncbi:hypothetical protein TanjilG_31007 [Lupinus angustifolius]|uniref:Major facilitator superfamily (MFS) profile domain-containing protein n=1 Tax=Lupinus angustifolius TaxID=3871 RepID=A0A1J7GSS1_LUPAN|nr:hypothetical protein TanjilG_31007 [Lupinus angustifolius]
MSLREENEEGRDLKKPFLHAGSWYRMSNNVRQSSLFGSTQAIRDSSISVFLCVFIVALGPIQFGFTAGYTSPTQSAIISDLGLSVSESLMIASIPNIIGWLVISFAKDTSFLYMGRLLEGFGVGIISYTVPVYIAEIAPQNLRGALVSVNQLSVAIGTMLAYLLGIFVEWRILAVLGILPCALLTLALFFIPESPRWLAKIGLTDEFETSLQVLRGFDVDISVEVNEIKIGIGLLILQQLSGINGVFFYSSTIFQNAGITSSDIATFGVGIVQVLATCVTLWLVDKAGRRILLIVSSAGMAFSLLVVAISFYMKDYVSENSPLQGTFSILSLVGVVAMVIAFSAGMGAIPWIIMSEILPINIKGLAGSVATLASWLFSWLVTLTANLLLGWNSGGTFTIYAVVCIFTVVFVSIWVPETKGKTLEEIQLFFK